MSVFHLTKSVPLQCTEAFAPFSQSGEGNRYFYAVTCLWNAEWDKSSLQNAILSPLITKAAKGEELRRHQKNLPSKDLDIKCQKKFCMALCKEGHGINDTNLAYRIWNIN